jgi:hypothetical protein
VKSPLSSTSTLIDFPGPRSIRICESSRAKPCLMASVHSWTLPLKDQPAQIVIRTFLSPSALYLYLLLAKGLEALGFQCCDLLCDVFELGTGA